MSTNLKTVLLAMMLWLAAPAGNLEAMAQDAATGPHGAPAGIVPTRSGVPTGAHPFMVRPRTAVFAAPSAAQLTYNGGRILSNVQVVQVLWGPGSYMPEVAGTVTPNMQTGVHDIVTGPYMDWLGEYSTAGVTATGGLSSNQVLGRGSFVGPFQITPSAAAAGTSVTESQIQSELIAQITSGGLPPPSHDAAGNTNTYYELFFPPGVTITDNGGSSSCQVWCGEHGTMTSTFGEMYFGMLPDMQAAGACGAGCGTGTPFENTLSVATHELIETTTDAEVGLATTNGPYLLAWYDNNHGEIGDICNGHQGIAVNSDGATYVAQTEFSNLQHACVSSAAVAIAHGSAHACALASAGTVSCWGANANGQLGTGNTTPSTTPVAVPGLSGVVALAAGANFTCALNGSGAVSCWGQGSSGQLGNAATSDSSSPVQVTGLTSGVIAIAAGTAGNHACALLGTGAIKCWGLNSSGQLGNNSTTNASQPVTVAPLPQPAVALAAGGAHTCAILDTASSNGDTFDGYCWGANASGQLGIGSTTNSLVPVALGVMNSANDYPAAVVAGAAFTCFVGQPFTANAFCAGDNTYGQLGNGSQTSSTTLVQVGMAGGNTVLLSAGDQHACAVDKQGAIWCWGHNANGQLGIGSTTDALSPTAIGALNKDVPYVSAGPSTTCAALGVAGTVQCWGANASGQLGDGGLTDSPVPVAASGLNLFPAPQAQSITFATIPTQVFGGPALTATATASSGLTVYLATTTPSTCSVDAKTVTLKNAGTCTLQADQPGNTNFAPATQVLQSFSVAKASQTITFGAAPTLYVGGTATVSATASSGGPVTFTSGSSSVCSVSASTVTGLVSGTCTVQASQAGTANYLPASQTQSFTVTQGTTPQTITFGVAPAIQVGTTGTVSATGGGSGNPVTFASLTLSTCTLQGATVSGMAAATCTIQASQAGNATYAAGSAQLSFQVNQGTQVITFGAAPSLAVGGTATVTASGGASGNPVVFSSATTGTCSVSASTVSGLAAGPCTILANQAGNANYASAAQASLTFQVVTVVYNATAMVSGGDSHTCALDTKSVVYCWGDGSNGALGTGSTATQTSPVVVTGLPAGVKAIVSGGYHTCALTSAGAMYCWGQNTYGQIGNNSIANVLSPVAVSGLSSGVVAMAAGLEHTCALKSDNSVWCWGHNSSGQLGNGTFTDAHVPTAVTGLGVGSGVASLAAGQFASCAVTSGKSLACWGYLPPGDMYLGFGSFDSTPVTIATGVDAATNGFMQTCMMGGGVVDCVGDNTFSELGSGTSGGYSDSLVQVSGLPTTVASLSAAPDGTHACALTTGGAVWCWGQNTYGELGNQTTTDSPVAVAVTGLGSGVAQLTTGYEHSCAVLSSGSVVCWGRNDTAQLGIGTSTAAANPAPVSVLGTGGTGTLNLIPPTAQSQTISFPALPPRVRGQAVTLSASASSGLAVTFSSQTPTVCTVSGGHASLILNGTCTIAANQAGNGSYSAAPQVTQSFAVQRTPSDLNGDGRSDLLWSNVNGSGAAWLMNGTASLGTTAFGPFAGWTLVSSEADFDGNGQSDLVWTNANGAVSIWTMQGLVPASQLVFGPFSGWTLLSANSDFNGDGKTDLLWWNAGTGQAAIWLMNGTTILAQRTFGPYSGWSLVSGNNDFDGDGKSDLLWTNTSGAAAVWLMNGTQAAATASFGPFAGWSVVSGDADYNGDGKTDLTWVNANGAVSLWTMNGVQASGQASFGPYSGWSLLPGKRDFNGDGSSDLLWTNTSGAAAIWLMNGNTLTTSATYGPYSGWQVKGARADYNGDGNSDLLWTSTTGQASIWLMNGLTNTQSAATGPFTGWTAISGAMGP